MNSNSKEADFKAEKSPAKFNWNIETNEILFRYLAAGILIFTILSRFLMLSDKPFHHDESLHGYYSERVSLGYAHEYSALLHGPMLYYLVGSFLYMFGVSDFTARLPAALFSVFIVASPLLLSKQIGRKTSLFLMFLFFSSPTFMYFGRFLREDVFTSVWVIGSVSGLFLYWQTRKLWTAYFGIAMLAGHFVNKENSYLHTMVWALALANIYFFSAKIKAFSATETVFDPPLFAISKDDKKVFWLNCFAIFVTIYVLFYSSFFRHSKGAWNGILDGLYRESLLYWWDQNSKRRIDGPFDYHLPIIANYEFICLPFLFLAWQRLVILSRKLCESTNQKAQFFMAQIKYSRKISLFTLILLILTFVFPRIALVPEACEYTTICLQNLSPSLADLLIHFVKPLHAAHSRHILQIICFVVIGGVAFFNALYLRRRTDAFLWFWLTGSAGIYSYVGEKVPWLVVYILIPLFFICALEMGRIFSSNSISIDKQLSEIDSSVQNSSEGFSNLWKNRAILFLIVVSPFTLFKAIRVSFSDSANSKERLVFTQSTSEVTALRDRWREAAAKSTTQNIQVTMSGDSTWPMAWYASAFKGTDFSRPTKDKANNFDVILLDLNDLESAKKDFPQFKMFEMSLRSWWVPGQDPNITQILNYFFRREIYPRTQASLPTDNGTGDTKILVLERASTGSPFSLIPDATFMKRVYSPFETPKPAIK